MACAHASVGLQCELQQSRSLAHELQQPIILWEQVLAAAQRVFSSPDLGSAESGGSAWSWENDELGNVPGGNSNCLRDRGGEVQEGEGVQRSPGTGTSSSRSCGESWDAGFEPDKGHTDWCERLEEMFRESAAPGGSWRGGLASGHARNGSASCACVDRFLRSARQLAATRFFQRLVENRMEADRLRTTQEILERARHSQLLLLRLQNGEDAEEPASTGEMAASRTLRQEGGERAEEKLTEEEGHDVKNPSGLWHEVVQCARACVDARNLSSAILSSAATAAFSGLEEWEIEPHRTLVLEMSARSMPSNPLFLDIRAAHHPTCHLLVFTDLLVLRGQPHPEAMRGGISAGWTSQNGRLVRDTSGAAHDCVSSRSSSEWLPSTPAEASSSLKL